MGKGDDEGRKRKSEHISSPHKRQKLGRNIHSDGIDNDTSTRSNHIDHLFVMEDEDSSDDNEEIVILDDDNLQAGPTASKHEETGNNDNNITIDTTAAQTTEDADGSDDDVFIVDGAGLQHDPHILETIDDIDDDEIMIIPPHSPRTTNPQTTNEEITSIDLEDPNVSVELIDDWFGRAEDLDDHGQLFDSARRNRDHTHTQFTEILSDDNTEDDDELIMLDGNPIPTTEQLLSQITDKNKDKKSTTPVSQGKTFRDVTCVICMDPIKDTVAAACGHVFCSECIYRALATSREPGSSGTGTAGRSGKCPMCRKLVAYKNLVWLKVRYRKASTGA